MVRLNHPSNPWCLDFWCASVYICTHILCEMQNVTLSLPDDLLRKSREYASKHGTSLNELIRTLLRRQISPEESGPIDKLIGHTQNFSIPTKGWKWNRADAYDRKVFSWSAQCHTVLTEDLQHGAELAGVRIQNPFVWCSEVCYQILSLLRSSDCPPVKRFSTSYFSSKSGIWLSKT